MAREVKLGIELREWQKDILDTDKRFSVLVCHRRAGKTIISLLKILKDALSKEKKDYAYIAPTYRQAKKIAWKILKRMVENIPNVVKNESELSVSFENGSEITLFGSNEPDGLRGLDIYGVVFDEYAQQPSYIYSEIIFPMINANGGWAQWIGTPKGKNDFWVLSEKAKENPNYNLKILPVSESKLLTEEQLEMAREEMTDDEYEQEYECSFDAAIKGAYYKKEISELRKSDRIKSGLYDPVLPVYTIWDLGISDNMAILFVQIHGGLVRIIDSESHNGEGFPFYQTLFMKKGYNFAAHYFPHDIKVRELSSGQSRLETVKAMFGANKIKMIPNMKIMDGIQAARRNFPKFRFDAEKTVQLVEALALYRQATDKNGMFLDRPEHDWTSHYADAFRYLGITYGDMTKDKGSVSSAHKRFIRSRLR